MEIIHFIAWKTLKLIYKVNILYRKAIDWSWVSSRCLTLKCFAKIVPKETGFVKLPRHLAVIFLPNCFKPEEFEPLFDNLVRWCLIFKIGYLTLYWPDLCETFELGDFLSTKVESHKFVAADNKPADSGFRSFRLDQKTSTLTAITPFGQVLRIKLRSKNTWSEEFQWAAQSFNSKVDGPGKEETYKKLCHELKNSPFPEANLIITPGSPMQLYGFPPMQLRIAEFYQNPFPHRLMFSTFLEALQHYSKTQQRNGK
ncbi:hypothetical protein DSO57_1027779 [Entomophthora muscae]|uniref:Uncharacterized protein n=1 Tax=Entomophthora muscae TaxID=34485 RepID=A0ACC2SEK6_9FUNG|nr:hypothetical protein DSO57_1027779 [Entomophthora muscae]